MSSSKFILALASLILFQACDQAEPSVIPEDDSPGFRDPDLDKISLPPGFRIDMYAADVPGARSLSLSDSGVLYVGTRGDRVYAVVDTDEDMEADTTYILADGLRVPNGVAYRNGDLYVAEIDRILRYDEIERNLSQPPPPVTVFNNLPSDTQHGWKYIAFGLDGKLYVPIGAPCNICDAGPPYSSLWRMNSDGSQFEEVAAGIRNTVGFDWHPVTGELWFTDNQRDYMGDDVPNDELNRIASPGLDFGYPHFHAGNVRDPGFGEGEDPEDYEPPAQKLGPHVAPLGIEFYTGSSYPPEYHNQIFVAEHGSWNRSEKIGYRVSLITLDAQSNVLGYTTFAEGWLEGQQRWGRPVDMELLPDGSLLLSDDFNGAVYRISYTN